MTIIAGLVLTAAGVVGTHAFIVRYWWTSRGRWVSTPGGRYMWAAAAGWAALFDVAFLNRAVGDYWARDGIVLCLYAALIYIGAWWPHRLLTISLREARKDVTTVDRSTSWWRLVHLDPALLRGLVVAAVALLASVGVYLSPAVPDGLVAVLLAVAAIVQAVWTRAGVTPVAKVVVYAPDPADRPGYVLAGDATTRASDAFILAAARSDPTGRASTVSGQD